MTKETQNAIRSFVWQRVAIWAIGGALWALAAVLAGIFTPLGQRASAIWHGPEQLEQIMLTQQQLLERLSAATGEDRVIRQIGLSYVEEPVYEGENVVLWLSVQRTTLGRDCRLVESVPLFTDSRNITLPGRRADPTAPRRQINDSPARIRSEWAPPRMLQPGRVEIVLSLEYDCAGVKVPEATTAIAFEIVAGPRPAD